MTATNFLNNINYLYLFVFLYSILYFLKGSCINTIYTY